MLKMPPAAEAVDSILPCNTSSYRAASVSESPRAAILGRKGTSSATVAAVPETAADAASAADTPPTVIPPEATVVAVAETPTQRLAGRRSPDTASPKVLTSTLIWASPS